MSWHCLYCGSSEEVTGLIELYDIRGGIPLRLCVHLKCFANTIKDNDEVGDIRDEIVNLDKENWGK